MLKRKFDPTLPYLYVRYGRMSDTKQNPRSPDQQFATIADLVKRLGHPWRLVATYRDDGISGRYVNKRPDFQRMLSDIEVGLIRVDLIVVDTLERLGRAEVIPELRRKLFVNHGVLVVTADSTFADPTGVAGKAIGMVENIRSTEDGRIKAHNVVRGKKDAVELGRWPGGPPPLGFRLKRFVDETRNPPHVYSLLEPVPEHVAAVNLAFLRAVQTGEGPTRLAQWWNACPDVPADLKPMSAATMRYMLNNKIYVGTLVWGANCTGVVDDTRVVEKNPDGPTVVKPGFCESVVEPALFEQYQRLSAARADQSRRHRAAPADAADKVIAPQARGLTLKYLLTGLVRCGACQSSMRPVCSGRKSKAGKRYVYYACPRGIEKVCGNTIHVPEDRLREAVVGRLRARLFPPPELAGGTPDWLPKLCALVRQEMDRYRSAEPDRAAARAAEMHKLAEQINGWGMTLGDPKLPATVREDIVARYENAKSRSAELEAEAQADDAREGHLERMVDPKAVLEQLKNLGEVLATHNPTLGNLELGRHIDRVACHADGRVEVHGTWLGVLDGACDLLRAGRRQPPAETTDYRAVTPRRRGRLRLPNLSADRQDKADVDSSLDPRRFESVAAEFLWTEPVMLEGSTSWAEANACEVAALRKTGLSHAQLAERFDKSVPTIRAALQVAAAEDPDLRSLPRKRPRARWPEQHYREVGDERKKGKLLKDLCEHFGKSEPLIREALRLAAEAERGAPGADGLPS